MEGRAAERAAGVHGGRPDAERPVARGRAGAATAAARTASESAAAAHASARRLQEEHTELERAATEAARELEEADPFTTKPQLRAELDTPEARAQVRARTYI